MMNKIIIVNGPNLNLLGEREKEKYGNFSLKDIENNCKDFSKRNNIKITLYQSNIEGELIDKIQESKRTISRINNKCWRLYTYISCDT